MGTRGGGRVVRGYAGVRERRRGRGEIEGESEREREIEIEREREREREGGRREREHDCLLCAGNDYGYVLLPHSDGDHESVCLVRTWRVV